MITSGNYSFCFDPFYSRGTSPSPSPLNKFSFGNVNEIFLGHGHFDHAYDVPEILNHSDARVYSGGLTSMLLRLRGVPLNKFMTGANESSASSLSQHIKIYSHKGRHVQFDMPLVLSTLKRCGVRGCLGLCSRGVLYPKGLVQTYYFVIDEKKFLFMSSAGASEEEIMQYKNLEVDYLLAPLQGHSQIQKVVANLVMAIKPKVVIPHHHDDFYPPLSQDISIQLFREELIAQGFRGEVLELPIYQSCHL